ncbi:ASCH domain-containing protein [Cochlodiniinecator piscidefendens]|uniref:ASCH domain-containing protein n=1 Tax=Cochlodiniinecator piscidefendens TaxID=2715756 RepID=UPI00140E1893
MNDEIEDLNDTYPGAGTFKFGDSEKRCNRLISLVREGKKTANCDALSVFGDDEAALPQVGRCDIATTWDDVPALVLKTTGVKQIRFCDVTEDMALADGENDSLAGWQQTHKAYFERNGGFDPEMILVFEHFELIENLAGREIGPEGKK